MTPEKECREAFEHKYPYAAYRDGDGYQDIRINGHVVKYLWEGWQAAWQAAWNTATQPPQATDAHKQELLAEMRCQAVYSDNVTMPIQLYERIKAALQSPAVPMEAQPIETAPENNEALMLWVDGEWWFGRREFDYWKVFGYPKDRGRPNPQFWCRQPPNPVALLGGKEGV